MELSLPEPRKSPPESVDKNKQYDLFTTFFSKDPRDLSNTIELWDAIPKYAVSPRQQNASRDDNWRLPVHVQEFEYRPSHLDTAPITCRLKVQPASIEIQPGKFMDFYPSTDEELIEEVLKKIFADQQYGMHSVAGNESWVRFTLYMIQKELKTRGKSRSIDEIKRSLEIMSQAVVEVGRVPIFPVRLRAEPGVKWPYVSTGSTAPPCSTSARAIWPLHRLDTKRYSPLSSAD